MHTAAYQERGATDSGVRSVYLRIVARGEAAGRWGWTAPKARLVRHREAASRTVGGGRDTRAGRPHCPSMNI